MNKNEKAYIAVTAVVVGVTAVRYLKVRKTERAKRAKIEADLQRDLAAISIAGVRILERIHAGEYRDKYLHDVEKDFEFEIIAVHLEQD